MEPHLGGNTSALDLIGVNYYYNCQMEVVSDVKLDWEKPDHRYLPFSSLLAETWNRYHRPLIISETGHFGNGREKWLDMVLQEINTAQIAGTPIDGVCVYPILDRPCWHEPTKIIRAGLIEMMNEGRRYHLGSAKTLRRWQQRSQGKAE
jgi:beta-glucosidase/6-phospho-beta-glucosidase/beta-galactosidase